MSELIDSFKGVKSEINGGWWIAKPLPFYSLRYTVKTRLRWVWEILMGKAIAVHFKEDEGRQS